MLKIVIPSNHHLSPKNRSFWSNLRLWLQIGVIWTRHKLQPVKPKRTLCTRKCKSISLPRHMRLLAEPDFQSRTNKFRRAPLLSPSKSKSRMLEKCSILTLNSRSRKQQTALAKRDKSLEMNYTKLRLNWLKMRRIRRVGRWLTIYTQLNLLGLKRQPQFLRIPLQLPF